VGRQCVHGHILSACLPFRQRFQRAGSQNPRFSQLCAPPICKPFLSFLFMNCFTSKAQRDSAYVAVVTLLWLSIPLFSFSRSSFAGEKKGLNLIHFLTWRKTRTKNLKTTEFLELCGRVLSLILSRYVSDSIWTIVKISWWGVYAKSFRVRQSSLDTRLVDFLENRKNAFLLLLVEICANIFSFSGRARTSTFSAFAFHSQESFGFPSMISLQHAADRRYV
jgi:hypothetical protein